MVAVRSPLSPLVSIAATLAIANFPTSSEVILTATPDSSSSFTGWSGVDCPGTGSCTVTLTDTVNVTAEFTQHVSLTVNHAYSNAGAVKGGGTISGSGDHLLQFRQRRNHDRNLQRIVQLWRSRNSTTAAADAAQSYRLVGRRLYRHRRCSFSIAADTTVTGTFAGTYKAKLMVATAMTA